MSRPRILTSPLTRRRCRVAAAAVAVALAGTALFGAGQATAGRSVPRSDREIQNLDKAKERIAAYYGDTQAGGGEHYASPDSNYAKQVRGIASDAQQDLRTALAEQPDGAGSTYREGTGGGGGRPAIVLDVDDTTLLTYNFERRVGYAFSDEAQDEYLRTTDMGPVFGMRKLVNWAHRMDVSVFFLTGREEHQRDWSVRNLAHAGYRAPADRKHFFLKDEEHPPPYLKCGSDCTTVEYKSGTREHIESLGFDILANFGDQYSDLRGGHAERTYKLPNPMYYLP